MAEVSSESRDGAVGFIRPKLFLYLSLLPLDYLNFWEEKSKLMFFLFQFYCILLRKELGNLYYTVTKNKIIDLVRVAI